MATSWITAALLALGLLFHVTLSTPVLYDGRAPLNMTESTFDALTGAYVYVVKGSKNASEYVDLNTRIDPTPLWSHHRRPSEKTISVSIDNSSVFIPGGNAANSQYGFRRTEVIAQSRNRTIIENGITVFHFSVMRDEKHDLNYKHEYQLVFIEPNDGSHVFGLQIGSPFTYPTASRLPVKNARSLRILAHNLDVVFETSFDHDSWHNFAVQVDWNALTLGVYFSQDEENLRPVMKKAIKNIGHVATDEGKGDFHFGVLKLPIADPKDNSTQAGDVVHRGIQEGTLETLHYSGVFVEGIGGGVSTGYGQIIPALRNP